MTALVGPAALGAALVLVQCLALTAAAPGVAGGGVIELNTSNFHLTNEGLWFVEFMAPWCHNCKNMEPALMQLARAMADRALVGKVNCEENKDLCRLYGVQAYPWMFAMAAESMARYAGTRTAADMEHFLVGFPETPHEKRPAFVRAVDEQPAPQASPTLAAALTAAAAAEAVPEPHAIAVHSAQPHAGEECSNALWFLGGALTASLVFAVGIALRLYMADGDDYPVLPVWGKASKRR